MADKLKWFPVTVSDPNTQKAYEAFQAANAKAKAARESLEKMLKPKAQAKAPDGHHPIFSYRFGRIAVAFQEGDGTKPATKSLSDGLTL